MAWTVMSEKPGPSPPAESAEEPPLAGEERFWRGGTPADLGAVPPEPGTTPAEIAADEPDPEAG